MTDKQVSDGIARIEGLLSTLVKLQMAPILEKELQDDFCRKLWTHTGKATAREIQKKLKCGANKISETWTRWRELGLVVKDGKAYRKAV